MQATARLKVGHAKLASPRASGGARLARCWRSGVRRTALVGGQRSCARHRTPDISSPGAPRVALGADPSCDPRATASRSPCVARSGETADGSRPLRECPALIRHGADRGRTERGGGFCRPDAEPQPLRQRYRGRSRYRRNSLSVPRITIVLGSITFSYVSSDRVKA